MPLLNQRAFKTDTWTFVEDDQAIPSHGDIVVSLNRLVAEFKILMLHPDRLGVEFPNTQPVATLEPYLQRLQLIVLEFPVFTDGRAYSQARELRSYFSYSGELRARGNLLPDQLGFMQQVGFDWFDVSDERFNLNQWVAAAEAISVTYQRGLGSHEQVKIVPARAARNQPNEPQFK
ncbi:MAG: DUF934 domain-containing protein [Hyphomicrobiales bacterium]